MSGKPLPRGPSLPHTGLTVGAVTLRALRRYPDRTAFSWDGGALSYAGATDLIGRIQRVYAEQRLRRGQRIAVLTGNRAESWCAAAAAQASGLVLSWLHPLGSLPDQLFQLADLDAAAVVVDAERFAARGAELAEALDGVAVLAVGPADFAPDLLAAAERVGAGAPVDVAEPGDVVAISYTGGTTGRSKGALRRHPSAVLQGLTAILGDFELPADPRYLAVAPISHVAGTKIIPTLVRGGTVHLLTGFAPDRVLDAIARERLTFTLLVPTMIYALLDHPDLERTDLSSLELLLYGASPMSATRLVEGLERIGPVFSQLYGQTECYPISVLHRAEHDPVGRPELLASCGAPVSTVAVALLDASGAPVPVGEPGELCVRGGGVMEEYWQRPELTAETFAHGWLHTGDIARADDQGYLYIVDRAKDMIISGGFNVYPREVEDALAAHPAVSSAAVYGVPDEKWGEAVHAAVVLRADPAGPDPLGAVAGGGLADELIAHVKALKGSVHAPKSVRVLTELPMTAVGKIDKKALREQRP
ncbi:MAG TPA: AMP-binding protein [Pseudonocardia sp.]|nr:AMP-binding protein [Pseudonocardia sp.]